MINRNKSVCMSLHASVVRLWIRVAIGNSFLEADRCTEETREEARGWKEGKKQRHVGVVSALINWERSPHCSLSALIGSFFLPASSQSWYTFHFCFTFNSAAVEPFSLISLPPSRSLTGTSMWVEGIQSVGLLVSSRRKREREGQWMHQCLDQ